MKPHALRPGAGARIACLVLAAAGCGTLDVERLAAPVRGAAADPALAVDPATGDVVMSWLAGTGAGWRIAVARSSDGGSSWSAPVEAAPAGEAEPHGEAAPRLVAARGGRLAVTWVRDVAVPGRQWPAGEIRLSRSADGGRSWSAPVTLNDDTTGTIVGHNFHGAAWAGDSGLVVAWLDERGGGAIVDHAHAGDDTHADPTSEPDARIYAARSTDFGASWHPNVAVWGAACPCCRVALARRPDGGLVAAWRKHYPGNVRDVVTAPLDGGAAGAPARVHQDGWVFPGCPHAGPAIAVDARGVTHVAWYTGVPGAAGVRYARVDRSGRAIGRELALVSAAGVPTAHVAVTPLEDGGAVVAYDVTARGDRRVVLARVQADGSLGATAAVPGGEDGAHPQLARTAGGAVVAWTASAAGDEASTIGLARVRLPR